MDHVSTETRSAIMRAVKSRGARSTEKRLRAVLVARRVNGWRINDKSLPGKPDFIFEKQKVAVFVDGCFWHGCHKCYRRPHSNTDYWDAKVLNNKARDKKNRSLLRRMGWRVVSFWEHEIASNPSRACEKIRATISAS